MGEYKMRVVAQVKESLSLFKNLYDILRIIDPITKKILYIEGEQEEEEQCCYCFWGKDTPCDNCVTMRSYMENDTFVKLAYKENRVFFLISTPVLSSNSTYIVELLKDISDKGAVSGEGMLKLRGAGEIINEMNEKVIRDVLTGIYNRRYINERLPIDINKCITEGQPLSIIMADIDFFKNINDTYGHVIGDKVLIDFARLIERSIRKDIDWVGRYGGEEFLIVLNNTDSVDAYKTAENIRLLLENTTFKYDTLHINITSSFGACSANKDTLDVESLIINADKNLYKAKNSGRNKTISDM
jgi:diguanylate cyclase (GGDEF)-like protein